MLLMGFQLELVKINFFFAFWDFLVFYGSAKYKETGRIVVNKCMIIEQY